MILHFNIINGSFFFLLSKKNVFLASLIFKSIIRKKEISKRRKMKYPMLGINHRRTDNAIVKRKKTNDLQSTTQKTKDRATRTPLKTVSELRCSERVGSSCSTSGTHCVTLV
jgi:hypothetical protein